MEARLIFSIIIPTYKQPHFLKKCLESIFTQDLGIDKHCVEVIIVNDGSHNLEYEYVIEQELSAGVKLFGGFTYLTKKNSGPAGARNFGVKNSSDSTIKVFLDGDCMVHAGWLQGVEEKFEKDRNLGIMGGQIYSLDIHNPNFISRYEAAKRARSRSRIVSELQDVDWVGGANLAIKAELFKLVGGYDERYKRFGGEETDLCRRVREKGYRVCKSSRLMKCGHFEKRSLISFLRTYRNYGRGARIAKNGERLLYHRANKYILFSHNLMNYFFSKQRLNDIREYRTLVSLRVLEDLAFRYGYYIG